MRLCVPVPCFFGDMDFAGAIRLIGSLGFDAAEDFHRYAFEWRPDRIDWFVDGERVHTVYDSIPSTPGKIMVNLWCSTGADHWTGPFDPSVLPLSACYEWISFTPLEAAQP